MSECPTDNCITTVSLIARPPCEIVHELHRGKAREPAHRIGWSRRLTAPTPDRQRSVEELPHDAFQKSLLANASIVAGANFSTSEMKPQQADQITHLLRSWSQGDEGAVEKLVPLVYDELHRLAHRHMSDERSGHTLQTTALLNEAYVRLVDSPRADWEGRTHFFAACAQVMRHILVDWARSRQALKRGGGAHAMELDEALAGAGQPGTDLVAVDDALRALAAIDPRKGQVVELRFFGGMNMKEIAKVLNCSVDTVQRDWKIAKSWLRRELRGRSSAE